MGIRDYEMNGGTGEMGLKLCLRKTSQHSQKVRTDGGEWL